MSTSLSRSSTTSILVYRLHDYTLSLFVGIYNNYIYSYSIFQGYTFQTVRIIRMQIQYAAVLYKNQLHWGKHTKTMHPTKLTEGSLTRSDSFLKWRDSGCFPQSVGICTAFPRRRANRNSSKVLEEMFLDRLANKSDIVDFFSSFFFSCDRLTEVNYLLLFYIDRSINWACAGKKYGI